MSAHPAEYVSAVQFLWYGHRNVPKPSDFENAWKAVKTIAAGDGALTVREQVRLIGKMYATAAPPEVVANVVAYTPGEDSVVELLESVDVPEQVRPGTAGFIIYEALGVMIADGPLTEEDLVAAREAATAMGIPDATVATFADVWQAEEDTRARRVRELHATFATDFRFDNETEIQVLGRTADLTEILGAARRAAGDGA